ncbi:MAG: hypothetical protein V2B19_32840 [Pseudomonadota bacterium]
MMILCCLILWSLAAALAAGLIWSKIKSNVKVHVMVFLSGIYFLGVFGGYGYLLGK